MEGVIGRVEYSSLRIPVVEAAAAKSRLKVDQAKKKRPGNLGTGSDANGSTSSRLREMTNTRKNVVEVLCN